MSGPFEDLPIFRNFKITTHETWEFFIENGEKFDYFLALLTYHEKYTICNVNVWLIM